LFQGNAVGSGDSIRFDEVAEKSQSQAAELEAILSHPRFLSISLHPPEEYLREIQLCRQPILQTREPVLVEHAFLGIRRRLDPEVVEIQKR
jgi:hypothetical protein